MMRRSPTSKCESSLHKTGAGRVWEWHSGEGLVGRNKERSEASMLATEDHLSLEHCLGRNLAQTGGLGSREWACKAGRQVGTVIFILKYLNILANHVI